MRNFRRSLFVLLLFVPAVSGQIPAVTHIQILKAEDARRYDKTLEDLLKSPSEDVRTRAALAVGRIGNTAAVPALVRLLNDPSARVSEMAAFALGEIESIAAAEAIQRLIGETGKAQIPGKTDPGRGRLVEAAGKIAAANAKDPKAKELGEAIIFTLEAELGKGQRQDIETIHLALTAALRAKPENTDVTVAKFLSNSDAIVRADAANALARIRPRNPAEVLRKELNEPLRSLLSDKDPMVRASAARALSVAAEDVAVSATLVERAVSDTDSRVRVSAIRSLAFSKSEQNGKLLLARAEEIIGEYKASAFRVPTAKSELLELLIAIGRLLTNTRNEQAVDLIREFAKRDQGHSPEAYIARIRIAPGRGDDNKRELNHWRQYSTLAQVIGEFATLEPNNEEGKEIKTEAPDILRPLAKAYAEADPVNEADTIMAAPDVLRAYAGFKTADLSEILRDALRNKDVFIRATAAELIGELPASKENVEALKTAFERSLQTDKHDDDAQLAILDALFKLDKKATFGVLRSALQHPDYLVRRKALTFLDDKEAWKEISESEMKSLIEIAKSGKDVVWPHDAKSGTKLGQVLNLDADYRRAIARKNGTVKAVLATEKGNFTIDLLPEDAPLTVDNFIKLARARFFDGLEVHRVVPNFVMQDGDPRGDGSGGPGWSIRCEINMVPYERGAVGMALSGKDTGGSQWFVTHSPQPHLDGGYTVFGRVNETAMKVVDNIVRGDKIISVRIVEGNLPQSTQRKKK